jgi:hypothetical protein
MFWYMYKSFSLVYIVFVSKSPLLLFCLYNKRELMITSCYVKEQYICKILLERWPLPSQYYVFLFFSYLFVCFFGFLFVCCCLRQQVLAVWPRLVSNSKSSDLSLLSAGKIGIHHHSWLHFSFPFIRHFYFIFDLSHINNRRGFHCDNSVHMYSIP